jgi:transposase
MTNFLHLWQWNVESTTEHPDGYRVAASYEVQPASCPKCGVLGELYKHGTKVQSINDTTHSGKPVVIDWARQRYRCRACGGTFFQPASEVDDSHLMTKRLREHIEKAVLDRTYAAVAKEVGVSPGTARNVFYAYAGRLEAQHTFVAPEILGIDELHIRGRARCILTNIGEHLIVDFLEDRTKAFVYPALLRLEHRERVQVVAMDMYRPYVTLTRAVFPKALQVVDKFHIVRMASQSLDAVRKAVGKSTSRRRNTFIKRQRHVLLKRPWNLDDRERLLLSEWLGEMPDLKAAYELKERFYDIWETNTTVSDAKKALNGWRAAIPASLVPTFGGLAKTTVNWEPELLNYFATNGVTNAFTESCNRTLRDLDRAGRGYSWEVLRVKALFAHNDIVQRRPARLGLVREQASYLTASEKLGVPLSTFAAALTQHADDP